MKHYTLKLKTTSTVDYNLYDGTTLVSDSALNTLFATAGEAYFTFDFNSLTPDNTTALNILDSSSTAVIANTELTGIAEDKNFKGTWSASATAFDTFVELTGVAMDEAQISTLAGMIKSAGPTVVQTPGGSIATVMSQATVTGMVFADPLIRKQVQVGTASTASFDCSVGIGYSATSTGDGAIALGAGARAATQGEMNIGSNFTTDYGYNNSNYRLLTGLYDPQSAHDAATKGYVDGLVGDIETALEAILNGGES